MARSDRPWTALRPELGELLRPTLPAVALDALQEIATQLPGLGSDIAGAYGQALRTGVEAALERFLDLLGTREFALDPRLDELYSSFGGRESRHERPLDTLLAAYRIGARVAWAHFSDAAQDGGVDVSELVALAESIFVYIDELSAASASGHARDHAARTGFRDVLRSRLAEAIVAGEVASDHARVMRLADDLSWTMPGRLAVAVLPLVGRASFPLLRVPIAPPDALVLSRESEVVAVLPDPTGPGRRARLESLLGPDAEVYVGTVRPPEEAALSLAHARAVQRLVQDGVLPRAPVVLAAEHLPELVLHADPQLISDLRSRVLAPLRDVPGHRGEELARTLRVWLAHHGNRAGVAQELQVHPQTVSYRMNQLEELFGDTLHDPHRQVALVMALESGPPGG